MMTFADFKKIPPDTLVRVVITEHEKVEHGKYGKLIFAVKKGGANDDWSIYYHKEEKGLAYVLTNGDKVLWQVAILDIFPCDNETLSHYRK